MLKLLLLLLLAACVWSTTLAAEDDNSNNKVQYGVDISFPMQHNFASTNYAWLPHNVDPSIPTPEQYKGMPVQPLGDRQAAYDEFINGCIEKFGGKKKGGADRCRYSERDRIAMSLRQPRSMQNYTELGYKKIKAPKELFALLSNFWEKNKDKGSVEKWGTANTYT